MHIDLVPFAIAENEVVGPRVVELDLPVPVVFQQRTEPLDVLLLESDVEVLMRSGLMTKQSVDAPSPVEPNDDVVPAEFS